MKKKIIAILLATMFAISSTSVLAQNTQTPEAGVRFTGGLTDGIADGFTGMRLCFGSHDIEGLKTAAGANTFATMLSSECAGPSSGTACACPDAVDGRTAGVTVTASNPATYSGTGTTATWRVTAAIGHFMLGANDLTGATVTLASHAAYNGGVPSRNASYGADSTATYPTSFGVMSPNATGGAAADNFGAGVTVLRGNQGVFGATYGATLTVPVNELAAGTHATQILWTLTTDQVTS